MADHAVTRTQWAKLLLQRLGYAATSENVKFIVAWEQAEGTSARFNPLATTQQASGAGQFNSVGVKNYTSLEQGLDATVSTLRNGYYRPILAAMKAGTSARTAAQAVANSPWGTGGGVMRVLGYGNVQADHPIGIAQLDAPQADHSGAQSTDQNMNLGVSQTGDAGLQESQANDPLHSYVNALGSMLGTNLPAPSQWDPSLVPESTPAPATGSGKAETGTEPTTETVKKDEEKVGA